MFSKDLFSGGGVQSWRAFALGLIFLSAPCLLGVDIFNDGDAGLVDVVFWSRVVLVKRPRNKKDGLVFGGGEVPMAPLVWASLILSFYWSIQFYVFSVSFVVNPHKLRTFCRHGVLVGSFRVWKLAYSSLRSVSEQTAILVLLMR